MVKTAVTDSSGRLVQENVPRSVFVDPNPTVVFMHIKMLAFCTFITLIIIDQ